MIVVNGTQVDWREGMTVSDLLRELGDEPHCPVVRVGHQLITRPHFHNTLIPDGTEMHLLHLVAGG